MKAAADAGPLIHLSWIDRLALLGQLFDEVVAPEAVQQEVLTAPSGVLGVEALKHDFVTPWLRVLAVRNRDELVVLRASLGAGEAEAIVLAKEADADVVLLDERRARSEAARRGIPLTGTVGLLQTARRRGLIDAAYPLLRELQSAGFWLSAELLDRVQREEGGPPVARRL